MNSFKTIKESLESFASGHKQLHTANMFIHLIDLLGEEDFNLNFIQCADYHDNFENFYYGYHKQFRQCDMYDMEGAEFVGHKTYKENKKEWDDKAIKLDGHVSGAYLLFPIGGHLDMLFWNLIHVDSELWENSLKYTYQEYKEEKLKPSEGNPV